MATKNNASLTARIKNMFFPGVKGSGPPSLDTGKYWTGINNNPKELNQWRGPVQVNRIKVDTSIWRTAVAEAERPLPALPFRVQMQTIYLDTVLNGVVQSCIQKRKNLTLLKPFHLCDAQGNTNEEATKLINTEWFALMRNYIQDAQYYGYSLITFGDLIDGEFPNVQITRRTDVSPDRLNLASFPYIPTGLNFMQEPYSNWSLWVPTASENGVSKCGYGLLYKVALYEIMMRSILGWNTDYIERFGQPTTVIKTIKDNDEERNKAEQAAQSLGSSGYMILDINDQFELVGAKDSGSGWQSYDNMEARCKKTIASILLGHEDAISGTPGKLGSHQGEDDSPVAKALAECESIDTRFEEHVINKHLLPKLIALGIPIPVGLEYRLKNDKETIKERENEAKNAQAWANVALTMSQAGLKLDASEFEERTNLKAFDEPTMSSMSNTVKAKLKAIYNSHG